MIATAFKILGLLICLSSVFATEVRECDGITAPLLVEINNCETKPCKFIKGQDVIANVTFEAPYDMEKFSPKVVAHIPGSISVPYPLDKDGCKALVEGQCPIEEGEISTYQLKMKILPIFPSIDITLELSLENESNIPVSCFIVEGRVTG